MAANPKTLPTRENILAFVAREREGGAVGPIGKREIARAFAIKGSDKIELKRLLRELQDEGLLEKRGKALARPGALPPVTLCDVTGRDLDGELIARPVEWDASQFGPVPRILLNVPARQKPGVPVPGVGDRALVRAERARDPEPGAPAYVGRVIKLLSRKTARVLGVFRADARTAGGRIEPIDRKQIGRELAVSEADRGDARDGDLVAVDILRTRAFGLPAARVREVVGSLSSEKAVSQIAIASHDIPDAFRPATIAEAQEAKPAPMEAEGFAREDWRSTPLLTIDPPDAKDHDDAVFAEPDAAPDNEGGFVVTVAIADVSWYVRPNSALDREAVARGNSVYFPDRVVPMLPERISNDLCSLRPLEDRPALAVKMRLDKNGHKIDHAFHRVMMRSAAKLSYQQAQQAFDGRPDETCAPLMKGALEPLLAAYRCATQARDRRGPLDLDLPERKIRLKADGTVDRVEVPPRLEAHRVIEEFMILANVAAAETLEEKRQHLIYRAHDEPSVEKLHALSDFLATVGVRLAKGQTMRAKQFNDILARVKDTEHEHVVNEVVLRSQAQAEYTAQNYGHFGLNLRRYAHFTSPIRRYADLIVHRALVRALHLGPGGLPDTGLDELAEIAARISAAERRAMAAERETNDRLIAAFLADQIGATFSARISGVTRSGLFVKLSETGADGFVPASTLGDEYFRHEEAHAALVGSRSGRAYRLGDTVEARLLEVAPLAGAMRFEVLSSARPLKGLALRKGRSQAKPAHGGRQKSAGKSGKKGAKGRR
ncbi:MAG: ribonuclease R [Hyphomicrobiales bacterium]|nr:ribonuclease R [Hyphomicrobiales bacterium]